MLVLLGVKRMKECYTQLLQISKDLYEITLLHLNLTLMNVLIGSSLSDLRTGGSRVMSR